MSPVTLISGFRILRLPVLLWVSAISGSGSSVFSASTRAASRRAASSSLGPGTAFSGSRADNMSDRLSTTIFIILIRLVSMGANCPHGLQHQCVVCAQAGLLQIVILKTQPYPFALPPR